MTSNASSMTPLASHQRFELKQYGAGLTLVVQLYSKGIHVKIWANTFPAQNILTATLIV